GDDELPDGLAGRPRVQHIGGPAVEKLHPLLEHLVERGGREERVRDNADRLLLDGHRHDARVAARAQGVGEASDVVEAVGREVAVVDEEDVHVKRTREWREGLGTSRVAEAAPSRGSWLPFRHRMTWVSAVGKHPSSDQTKLTVSRSSAEAERADL